MSKLQDDIRSLCDLSVPAPGTEVTQRQWTRPSYHGDECYCESCANIRAAMNNYLEAVANLNVNNWWNS